MHTTPTSFATDEDVNMVKKFYIFSCAALVASFCLFSQDADAGSNGALNIAYQVLAQARRLDPIGQARPINPSTADIPSRITTTIDDD